MGKTTRLFVGIGVILGVSIAAAAFLLPGTGSLPERLQRVLHVGAPLLELRLPEPGQQVGVGAIEVLVGFRDAERVAPDTFRCLLNGDDVTQRLTLGRNGAGGSLLGLTPGPNSLRIEVFGRTWWGDAFVQEGHEVDFQVRPIPYLDLA